MDYNTTFLRDWLKNDSMEFENLHPRRTTMVHLLDEAGQ